MNTKRMHPLKIVQALFSLLKNSAIIIIYLFIVRLQDTSMFPRIGRIIFLVFLVYQIFAIVIDWLNTSYEIKHNFIHIYRGLFKKRHNRVPLASVQNVRRTTPFYYKFFKVTSLLLETSATDKRASITFEAITLEEAERIEQALDKVKHQTEDSPQDVPIESEFNELEQNDRLEQTRSEEDQSIMKNEAKHDSVHANRTVVFRPTRQELIRASFLSLSFLVVIPVMISLYENIEDFVSLEEQAKNIFKTITDSWLLIGITIFSIAIILVGSGVLWTFLKYGKYEIASDQDHIYIHMGILSERSLMIRKDNVQAIQIIQTPIKKWLGLCEVKLVSAESVEDDVTEISSLYPYMQKERAFRLIGELLSEFPIQDHMYRLPKKALTMKMFRLPWLFIIACLFVIFFQRTWWYGLPIIFVLTYLIRYFDYRNTRYKLTDGNIQFKKGGLWSSWFITNRKKVIEIEVNQSFLQQKLGLATIQTINQTKPTHEEELMDIPIEVSEEFIKWYGKRYDDIVKVEP